jgi:hypothetical protein
VQLVTQIKHVQEERKDGLDERRQDRPIGILEREPEKVEEAFQDLCNQLDPYTIMGIALKLTFSSADCTVFHKSMTTGKSTLVGIFLAQTLMSAELDASFFSRLSIAARRTIPSCFAPIKVGTVSMMVERTANAE